MKNGSVSFVTLFLAAIIAVGGYYFLVYQPRQQAVPVVVQTPPAKQDLASPDTPTIDETEIIKAAMKAAIIAKRGSAAADLRYTVSKIEGDYAQGGAAAEGGGAMWLAAKVNGTWQLVWDGNGVILCTDLTNYPDFPTSMVPECWNDITKKTVVR